MTKDNVWCSIYKRMDQADTPADILKYKSNYT